MSRARMILVSALAAVAVAGMPHGAHAVGQGEGAVHTCAAAQHAEEASLTPSQTIDAQLVTISYPPVIRCLPALEKEVRSFVDDYVATSVRFGEEYSDTERQEFLDMAGEAMDRGFAWSHDISIAQTFGNDRVVSLLASVWSYTGGAHGNLWFAPIVFDVTAGRRLELQDLFQAGTDWLGPIATFVREDLYRQKREAGMFESADGDDHFIEDGAAPTLENFQVFGIYGNAAGEGLGLSFHFAPYQVGAFAEGDFHVNVPAVVFDSYLSDAGRELFR